MLQIPCPWCGLRDQTEFAAHGEAHIARPLNPDALSDEEWGDYVFFRDNPKGWHRERWSHAFGCRRWFNMLRNTVTGEIAAVYKIGDPKPPIPTHSHPSHPSHHSPSRSPNPRKSGKGAKESGKESAKESGGGKP